MFYLAERMRDELGTVFFLSDPPSYSLFSFWFHPAVRDFLSPWCLRSFNFPICILLMTMGKNLSCVVFVITLFSEFL